MIARHKQIIKLFLPDGSRGRMAAGRIKRIILRTNANSYKKWIKNVEPLGFIDTIEKSTQIDKNYLFSIIVPCYNTQKQYIDELFESVLQQTYANWQLCIADGSSDASVSRYIQQKAGSDSRIIYAKLEKNVGIAGNTNEALKLANGEYIAFLDHDDVLSIYALAEVAIVLNNHPKTDLVYSDEDKLSDSGKRRLNPFFKPDWSPELLLGINYITHFVVVRKKLVDKLRGLREGYDGAQDYDFLLRVTETTKEIRHIPKILYHWRLAKGSTAKGAGAKSYATIAGRRALEDALKRRKIEGEALEIKERPTNYRPRFIVKGAPKVSIIIPFKDKVGYLKKLIPSILNLTTYENFEIVLISNNSTESSTFDYLESIKKVKKCRVYEWNNPFNYSAINNFGVSIAKGEYLVFLNNDTEVLTSTWLEELVGVAKSPDIGAVGPLLLYPNRTIQHAGVVIGMGGMAGHVFRVRQKNEWTDFGLSTWPRNYLAVTGACLVVSKSKFESVNGFDEQLQIGGNDIALCLRLYEKGLRNVFWPFAELIHYENVSVGPYSKSVPMGDYERSLHYYKPYLESGDPYFNPNLSLEEEAVKVRRKV